MPRLYTLSPGDRQIFKAATTDVDYFFDFYLRSDTTGTWWLPGATLPTWKTGYEKLYAYWMKHKCPNEFEFMGNVYRTVPEHEESKRFPNHPAFFHNHGTLMVPWAKMLMDDRTPTASIIGGFGSGKTYNVGVLPFLYWGATLPQFRGFILAPSNDQAEETIKQMLAAIEDTEYYKRFFIRYVQKPRQTLIVGNDAVGANIIQAFSISDGTDKLLTLTADAAMIDQAELIPNLGEVIRNVASRFRGRTKSGRSRLGLIRLVANSGPNQELWDIFDRAEDDPENYLSLAPSSYDNPYLTEKDFKRYESQVAPDEQSRKQYLFGERPLGNGSHFSRQVLQLIIDTWLDEMMMLGRRVEGSGYTVLEAQGVGIYEWSIPPQAGRNYLVVSDPGTGNPPKRDSPVILVWDITDFPGTRLNPMPAKLVGFYWVFGNGNIDNWATTYHRVVTYYKAYTTNAFDATGWQSGYDQWLPMLTGIYAEKINFGGQNKFMIINAGKVLAANAMLKIPKALTAITEQLSRYEHPEPNNLRQDITMAFCMSAWWLQRLFDWTEEEDDSTIEVERENRYARRGNSRR